VHGKIALTGQCRQLVSSLSVDTADLREISPLDEPQNCGSATVFFVRSFVLSDEANGSLSPWVAVIELKR
jgi:hypothetical protein